MKKRILVIVLCLACVSVFAQKRKKKPAAKQPATTQTAATQSAVDTIKKQQVAAKPSKPFDRPLDGYYKKANILSAKVTPYPNLRESDVAYAKRVWREIDTRE